MLTIGYLLVLRIWLAWYRPSVVSFGILKLHSARASFFCSGSLAALGGTMKVLDLVLDRSDIAMMRGVVLSMGSRNWLR